MIKKSMKYLGIAVANGTVLTILLALWTDKIAMLFDDWLRPVEFLKIIGCGFLSVIAMRILVSYFRKKNIQSVPSKMKIAVCTVLLVCSFLYVPYLVKVIDYCVIHGYERYKLGKKIVYEPLGSTADSLSLRDYDVITKGAGFPKLPTQATNIRYKFYADGFLPDYSIELRYELPKDVLVDTLNFERGRFVKTQNFEVHGDKKIVFYSEFVH